MKNLKRLRQERGYTQVVLAQMMGVTQSTLAGWEAGNMLPTADKLPMLADLLGVSIDALYGREPPGESTAAAS